LTPFWENGYIENFNGKLRDELLNGEVFETMVVPKALIEQWRIEYNTIKPHSSLGYLSPAPETFEPMPSVSATHQLKA
jgi:transposase InsO family protein